MKARLRFLLKLIRERGFFRAFAAVRNRIFISGNRFLAQVPVSLDDILAVNYLEKRQWAERQLRSDGPSELAWLMSPPGAQSGGHQNLFRFIEFAEQAGHRCTIYIYEKSNYPQEIEQIKRTIANNIGYPELNAEIVLYSQTMGVSDGTQAIFATGWETAYPAYLDKSMAKRFYFVQDFEPYFYAHGTNYMLAENTYKFGFRGVCAGQWLAAKLEDKFGMACKSFDFAADPAHYQLEPSGTHEELFFYARPSTSRRAFELGVLVLTEFNRQMPQVVINIAGWESSNEKLPFPYVNHGSLNIDELSKVYNRCKTALVLSATNMSLLPLELLACGVIPVVNNGLNNQQVVENEYVRFEEPIPAVLAASLVSVFQTNYPESFLRKLSESALTHTWQKSADQFLTILEDGLRE